MQKLSIKTFFTFFICTSISIKRMIVFGDSLTDTKNLQNITDGKSEQYHAQSLPTKRLIDGYIHQIPPNEVQQDGRFTDGYNWIDYFSKTHGIEVVNYAVGGSSLHNYKIPFREDIGMWGLYDLSKSIFEQWKMYKKDVEDFKLEFDPEDLVQFMGGGNDLMIQQDMANPSQMAEDMAWFTKQAKGYGFRKVVVGNLPQLPYTPQQALNVERQPEMESKIMGQNKNLEVAIASVNIFQNEFYPSDHYVNQQNIELQDMTTFVKNFDKQWSDVSTISIPCFYGACTINRGQYFKQFDNKFRVRSDAEEDEQFEQFHQIIKTGVADKNFQKKYSNTRCPPEQAYKYIFFDDLHPMSHGFRLIAIDFTKFIKSTSIGKDLPDIKMIDIFNNPIPSIYFPKALDSKKEEYAVDILPKSLSNNDLVSNQEIVLPEIVNSNQPIDNLDEDLNNLQVSSYMVDIELEHLIDTESKQKNHFVNNVLLEAD